MKKGLDERIEKVVLRWFSHLERMESDRIVKRVYVEERAGSHSLGRPWKRWINTVKNHLGKKWFRIGVNGQGLRRGMHGMEPVGLIPDLDELPQQWVEVHLWPSQQLKGYKGENLFFFSFLSFVSLLL